MAMIIDDFLREEISGQPYGTTCELKKKDTGTQLTALCVMCGPSIVCMVVLARRTECRYR